MYRDRVKCLLSVLFDHIIPHMGTIDPLLEQQAVSRHIPAPSQLPSLQKVQLRSKKCRNFLLPHFKAQRNRCRFLTSKKWLIASDNKHGDKWILEENMEAKHYQIPWDCYMGRSSKKWKPPICPPDSFRGCRKYQWIDLPLHRSSNSKKGQSRQFFLRSLHSFNVCSKKKCILCFYRNIET